MIRFEILEIGNMLATSEQGSMDARRARHPNWKRRVSRARDELLRELGNAPTARELLLAESAAALKIRLQRDPGSGDITALNTLRRLIADLYRRNRRPAQ
jgi:hypothetical protein